MFSVLPEGRIMLSNKTTANINIFDVWAAIWNMNYRNYEMTLKSVFEPVWMKCELVNVNFTANVATSSMWLKWSDRQNVLTFGLGKNRINFQVITISIWRMIFYSLWKLSVRFSGGVSPIVLSKHILLNCLWGLHAYCIPRHTCSLIHKRCFLVHQKHTAQPV